MNENFSTVAKRLLTLSHRASRGAPWTPEEEREVFKLLNADGEKSVLAACCLLTNQHLKQHRMAVGVVRNAVRNLRMTSYVEECIYEALLYLEPQEAFAFSDDIVSLIESSLEKGLVSMVNPTCLLGRIAKDGSRNAVALLRKFVTHADFDVRKNAEIALAAVGEPPTGLGPSM